jgi:hypothetical protein
LWSAGLGKAFGLDAGPWLKTVKAKQEGRGEFKVRIQLFERAQAALALSMALPVIVGAACIGADSWALHCSAVRLQALADKAVLTGAAYLPANPVTAERVALSKALTAGIGENEIVYNRPAADGRSITMVVERNIPYRFTRLFGLSQGQVIVKAVAACGRLDSAAGLVPIGIQYSDVIGHQAHRVIVLQLAPAERLATAGTWRPLELGSCDAGCMPSRDALVPSQNPVEVGEVLRVSEGGDRSGAIRSALLARLDMGARSDPGASAANYATGDPRRIEVALVDFNRNRRGSSGPSASVRGFASLWLTSVDAQGKISAELLDSSPGTGTLDSGARPEIGSYARD